MAGQGAMNAMVQNPFVALVALVGIAGVIGLLGVAIVAAAVIAILLLLLLPAFLLIIGFVLYWRHQYKLGFAFIVAALLLFVIFKFGGMA